MTPEPYLCGEPRAAFDRWLEASVARFVPPLTFAEVRKGVRALSALYVERRAAGSLAARAVEGRGKRAALATCYGPLHFLTAWHALDGPALERLAQVGRIHDLGCGTGAAGAAVGLALGRRPRVAAIDRSGWALGEARRTYAAFGLAARLRRAALPRALPARSGPEDLLLAGWALNELGREDRDAVLTRLLEAARSGAHVLVLEPLAGPVSPWWDAWAPRFTARGAEARLVKRAVALPDWLARLDRAAGLDHAVLGARVLLG